MVCALAVIAIVIVSRLSSATADRAAPEAPATSSGAAESRPTNAPTTGAPSTATQPAQSITIGSGPQALTGPPLAPLPSAGPGLTQPGILLVASPASDGSFDVLERVRLASPVSVLTLRPAPIEQAGRQFASASAAATQVQVSAGDQPLIVPGATVDTQVDLPVAEVDQYEIRYRLSDVTVRSTPSTDGRALAAIGPLTGGVDDDLPVLFVVSGGTVLGLSCPLLPLAQQSCGSRAESGANIEREIPWRLALASVQFDVPAA